MDYKVVTSYAGYSDTANRVRTCLPDKTCSVVYLASSVAHDGGKAPALCPSGWIEADLKKVTEYGAGHWDTFNVVRTCYMC